MSYGHPTERSDGKEGKEDERKTILDTFLGMNFPFCAMISGRSHKLRQSQG